MPFSEKVRTKALLWSDRHCCLCKKDCGPNIEVHHIVQQADKGTNDLENAIPLCFECHGAVCSYNERHAVGTKFKPTELKIRREQVYEEFTRHLVPPVHAEITQIIPNGQRVFPDVGFRLMHLGKDWPVRVRVVVQANLSARNRPSLDSIHYNGKRAWHLNPGVTFAGHFHLNENYRPKIRGRCLELIVSLTIIDCYDR